MFCCRDLIKTQNRPCSGKYVHYYEKPNEKKNEHNMHFWFGG